MSQEHPRAEEPGSQNLTLLITDEYFTEKLSVGDVLFEDEEVNETLSEALDGSIRGVEEEQEAQDDMDVQEPNADNNANMDVDPDMLDEEEEDNPVQVQEPCTPYDKFMSAIIEHCPHLKDLALQTHTIHRHTCE